VVLKREPDKNLRPLTAALRRDARQLAAFSPYRDGSLRFDPEPFLHNTDARIDSELARPGPIIEIWELSRRR
jgi:hypothetical protein